MNIHIWDSIGHGYPEIPGEITRHTSISGFEAAWEKSTALAIHTSEESPKESLKQVALRALIVSKGPLLFFSGASATKGGKIISDLPPEYRSRLGAFTASEFATRLRRAQSDRSNHQQILLAPNRIEVAVAALNALQTFEWTVELSRARDEIEEARDTARERFLLIAEQAGVGPLDPFTGSDEPSTLTATKIDQWMEECLRDSRAFNARLEAIRDSLLKWAASE